MLKKSNSPRLQPHTKASPFPRHVRMRDFPDLVVQRAGELLYYGLTYSALRTGTRAS